MDRGGQTDEISRVLSEVAATRDAVLGSSQRLAPDRLEALNRAVRAKFPLEAEVKATKARRDQLLSRRELVIPREVEAALGAAIAATEAARHTSRAWRLPELRASALRLLTSLQAPGRLAVATCVLASLAILHFTLWQSPPLAVVKKDAFSSTGSTDHVIPIEPQAQIDRDVTAVFVADDRFTLAVSANQLASLRSPFLATNRASLADASDESVRIRLDLPVAPILIDGAIGSIQ